MTPYEQGRHAEYTGKAIEDNPYTLDKQKRLEWYSGWIDSWREYNNYAVGFAHIEAYF